MVVFIDFPIALAPIVKFTGADLQPADKIADGNIGFTAPQVDKINNLISGIVGNPPGT